MKRILFGVVIAAFGGAAMAATPSASVLSVKQGDAGVVHVAYALANGPAIVTADIRTNGVSIGGEHLRSLSGDVNCQLETTPEGKAYAFDWFPDADWCSGEFAKGALSVVVTAWETSSPPQYVVIDLRTNDTVWYYPNEASLPGGISDRRYKTDFIALRRIPAANVTWAMGTPESESGTYRARHLRHKVRFTRDYYIAVYELTSAQYWNIQRVEGYKTSNMSALPSVLQYDAIRGGSSTDGCKWPVYVGDEFDYEASHAVGSDSVLGKLRTISGLQRLDLPTEAEWEYACRAGKSGQCYLDGTYDNTLLAKCARCSKNQKKADCEGLTNSYAVVGSYLPNEWGLYDMLGNAMEWVLDWAWDASTFNNGGPIDYNTPMVDPTGPTKEQANVTSSGNKVRALRGSYYGNGTDYTSMGFRPYSYLPNGGSYCGCRLCLELR